MLIATTYTMRVMRSFTARVFTTSACSPRAGSTATKFQTRCFGFPISALSTCSARAATKCSFIFTRPKSIHSSAFILASSIVGNNSYINTNDTLPNSTFFHTGQADSTYRSKRQKKAEVLDLSRLRELCRRQVGTEAQLRLY
jgi:hypothetical protein